MTIKELKEIVDKLYENSNKGSADVEAWLQLEDDTILCEIERIGQFNIIADMTITFKPVSDKVNNTQTLTEEQLDYRRKYEELEKRLNKIRDII